MTTRLVGHGIDPHKAAASEGRARNRGQAVPRCGADPIGHFAPHEGVATTAYGSPRAVPNPAAHGARRARLRDDPANRANSGSARRERSISGEDRVFWRMAPAPHVPLARP